MGPTSTAYPATLTSPLDQPDHASRFPRRPIFHQLSRHEPMDWLYPLSGFVVGAIVGLTGIWKPETCVFSTKRVNSRHAGDWRNQT